jgi:hypothetical protein
MPPFRRGQETLRRNGTSRPSEGATSSLSILIHPRNHDTLRQEVSMAGIIRIKFSTDQDRIQGNYVLMRNTVSRRLRGDIFEISDRDRKLLDDHQLHYTILPIPDPTGSDEEIRNTPTY